MCRSWRVASGSSHLLFPVLVLVLLSPSLLKGQQPANQKQRDQAGAPDLLRTAKAIRSFMKTASLLSSRTPGDREANMKCKHRISGTGCRCAVRQGSISPNSGAISLIVDAMNAVCEVR